MKDNFDISMSKIFKEFIDKRNLRSKPKNIFMMLFRFFILQKIV